MTGDQEWYAEIRRSGRWTWSPVTGDQEWYAEIRRSGRWTWWVTLHQGISTHGDGHHVLGSYERAEAKACTWLAQLRLRQDRWNDVHKVTE